MIIVSTYGRLTGDPQLNENRCNFKVAADGRKRDPQTHRPIAEFFNVTLWGKQAELAATYLHKGDAVFVSGEFTSDEFVGRDGKSHRSLSIENASFAFGERKRGTQDENDDDVLPD